MVPNVKSRFIKGSKLGCSMKHTGLVTVFLLTMFVGAQIIGLGIVGSYMSVANGELEWKELPSVGTVKFERPDVAPQVSVWYVVIAVIIGTLLILLLMRFGRSWLWKVWMFLAVVVCLQIALATFMAPLVALIVALIIGFFKIVHPNIFVHNLSELLIYGGLAAIFVPILDVFYAFMLLIILSVYDAYAVWKSKHMVKLAKFQAKSGVFAGMLLPYRAGKGKVKTAVLGGGDVGFPLMFAGTVLVEFGVAQSLLVVLGSAVALGLLLMFSQKDKFYPAMPFLTCGCALGFLVALLV